MRIGLDISVLNDKNRTGIGVYVYELVKALLKNDKKNTYILFGISTFQTHEYLKNLEFKNNKNVELKIYKIPARLFRVAFLSWQALNFPKIESLIGEVDIFHSFNWNLPPLKKGKMVATIFDVTAVLENGWHQEKTTQLEKVRFKRTNKYADLVVAISENSKKDFLKLYPKRWVEVVYPAVSDRFKQKIPRDKLRNILKKYNLEEGYLLSVSTVEPRKNLIGLIKAYLKSGVSNKLVLVGGKGWKDEKILELVGSNSKNIILTGFIPDEDLPYLYKGAIFLVYPPFYEGFGIPVLEAANLGIPVITSKTSSLPEVLGEGAFYINPKSIEDLANAIKKMSDKKNSKKYTELGLKEARKFSWDESAKKLLFLYSQVCTK